MHNACMAIVQIRDVDDGTHDELKARAARRGMSLNSYLRELLDREAATPDLAEVLHRSALRTERSAVSSVELIRADRDSR